MTLSLRAAALSSRGRSTAPFVVAVPEMLAPAFADVFRVEDADQDRVVEARRTFGVRARALRLEVMVELVELVEHRVAPQTSILPAAEALDRNGEPIAPLPPDGDSRDHRYLTTAMR